MHEVAITGLGALTALGNSAEATFDALLAGTSGVAEVSFPLDARQRVRIGAELQGFDAVQVLGPRGPRRHGRFTLMAIAAARQAYASAGLESAGYEPEQVGAIVGSGLGGIEIFDKNLAALYVHGPRHVSPFTIPGLIPNMAAAMVAIDLNAKGPCYSLNSACASGGHAIAQAMAEIQLGRCQVVIVGGAEAVLTAPGLAGFAQMNVLSRCPEPKRAARPFERSRDGFVMGEGAGMLVLERMDLARARGAPIIAALRGAGCTADAHHTTQPVEDGEGAARAMRAALAQAKVATDAVGYINAHGTGTPQSDISETHAIKRAFGTHAERLWVSSSKSMTGHLLGAAGAVEAVITALALKRQVAPPTINLDEADPLCDLDYVPHIARDGRFRYALSNSLGFGGQNVSLLFEAVD